MNRTEIENADMEKEPLRQVRELIRLCSKGKYFYTYTKPAPDTIVFKAAGVGDIVLKRDKATRSWRVVRQDYGFNAMCMGLHPYCDIEFTQDELKELGVKFTEDAVSLEDATNDFLWSAANDKTGVFFKAYEKNDEWVIIGPCSIIVSLTRTDNGTMLADLSLADNMWHFGVEDVFGHHADLVEIKDSDLVNALRERIG